MFEIRGKHNVARVLSSFVEDSAFAQIQELCNREHFADSRICIMPDVHAGKGCTIGTSMTIHGIVEPNLVGVDIGCGMHVTRFSSEKEIDLSALDAIIRSFVPFGGTIHQTAVETFSCDAFVAPVSAERSEKSLGTLGGGNHFIELSKEETGDYVLTIHSGSRSLGVSVCSFHQGIADAGKGYLEGDAFDAYIHDMALAQDYAALNRETIWGIISKEIQKTNAIKVNEQFQTIHNYIDMDSETHILRKGAVSACLGEKIIIPMNMRDGCLICLGKGNADWNFTAPHGAGRILSRGDAKRNLSLEEFREDMGNVFTTCVSEKTLDEAPRAYKPMETILENIHELVDVETIIKPVYNFKG